MIGTRRTKETPMWETVPRLLAENNYFVLATADQDGTPWATPAYFVADGTDRLFWVSSPDSRHSRNIAVRPTVGITVFDSHAPVGGAEALYFEATASLAEDDPRALDLLNESLPARQHLGPEDVGPGQRMRAYQANITQHYVLIRGGDPRFDNITDARLAVSPPA
jgi:general stress protein 26